MNIYSNAQEEQLYIQRRAKTWFRSGLVSKPQFEQLESTLKPGVIQSNLFFRILLFGFTLVCLGAMVGFVLWLLDVRNDLAVAGIAAMFSLPTYGLAEHFVSKRHFYRHGVEEALAVGAMILISYALFAWIHNLHLGSRNEMAISFFLVAVCFTWLYLRFGFLYAAIVAIWAASMLPFQFLLSKTGERLLLATILTLILSLNVLADNRTDKDFRKEQNSYLQALLFLGIYLTFNLRLPDFRLPILGRVDLPLSTNAGFPAGFYWTTYALVFALPLCGFFLGIRYRRRLILDVSALTAALSAITNKDYLGMKHFAWDPAIFGIMLASCAVVLMRFLNKGPGKERHGFTANIILKPEDHGIDLGSIGTAVFSPGLSTTNPSPVTHGGGGKFSGGGLPAVLINYAGLDFTVDVKVSRTRCDA